MRFACSPRTASRVIGGHAIVVGVDSNRLFTLNEQGTALWQVLASPKSIDELAASLVSKYLVTESTARQDCELFCKKLVAKGLIDQSP